MKILNDDTGKRTLKDVRVGNGVKIFDFVNAYGCSIGDGTKIGAFVEIQKGVSIGENCKISSHTFICEGVDIGSAVFVGHNVSFINDLYPRAINANGAMQTEADWAVIKTKVCDGASIGTGSTILAGITIGENSIIGAGSVVTNDVVPNSIVAGNPARFFRTISDE